MIFLSPMLVFDMAGFFFVLIFPTGKIFLYYADFGDFCDFCDFMIFVFFCDCCTIFVCLRLLLFDLICINVSSKDKRSIVK